MKTSATATTAVFQLRSDPQGVCQDIRQIHLLSVQQDSTKLGQSYEFLPQNIKLSSTCANVNRKTRDWFMPEILRSNDYDTVLKGFQTCIG